MDYFVSVAHMNYTSIRKRINSSKYYRYWYENYIHLGGYKKKDKLIQDTTNLLIHRTVRPSTKPLELPHNWPCGTTSCRFKKHQLVEIIIHSNLLFQIDQWHLNGNSLVNLLRISITHTNRYYSNKKGVNLLNGQRNNKFILKNMFIFTVPVVNN